MLRRVTSIAFLLVLLITSLGTPHAAAGGDSTPRSGDRPYTDSYQNSWAIVIGINAYQRLPSLTYAVPDAKAIANLLPRLGFPKENVLLLLDEGATKAQIESTVYRKLRQAMGSNDRLLVYFAGHGETLPLRNGEEGYILPVDADPEALPATAIAMQDVQRIAQRLPAKHYLFIMDSCFSGFAATRAGDAKEPATKEYLAAALQEPVVQVITAGRKGQRAIEDAGHGLFTRYLLEALNGQADQEGRGYLSAAQLAAWIESHVREASQGRMTPQYARVDGEGQFMLALPGSRLRATTQDLTGTFTGMIQGRVGDQSGSMPATVTFVQKGNELSGTWSTPGSSGTLTGIIDGAVVRAFRVNQVSPCPRVFHGTATVENNRNSVIGNYGGTECDGRPLSATFHGTRVEREPRFEESPLDFADYMNIGISYVTQKRPDDALAYLHKARQLAEEKRDDDARAQTLLFIGFAQQELKRPADAIDYLEQSLRLAERTNNPVVQRFALHQLGLAEQQQEHFGKAQDYFERALPLAQEAKDEAQQARLLYAIGVLQSRTARPGDARASFDKALGIAERLKLPELAEMRRTRDALP